LYRPALTVLTVGALGAALALGLGLSGSTGTPGLGAPLTHAKADTALGGDFIIRCFYNGNAAPEDPIDAPGSFDADHVHIFFGNMASGAAAGDGTAFPDMQSGDYSTGSDTMESNGLSTPTNCQDTKDTAGYWVPEPYQVTLSGSASVLSTLGNGCTTNCKAVGTNADFYQRVYYLPHGSTPNQEIPDGTIMISGYPDGCANIDNLGAPEGCVGNKYPIDIDNPLNPNMPEIVTYDCGQGTGTGQDASTPISAWPYDCTLFNDSSYSDGVVAIVNFPYCWNGQASFPAPNSPVNAQTGLPTEMVPGYVAPWIPYKAWQNYPGLTGRPQNDFAYPNQGNSCSTLNNSYSTPVVQLSERVHTLNNGTDWGEPSECTGFTGCTAATEPSPTGATPTLSFSCTHMAGSGNSGDPECDIGLSSPTGCVKAGGTCYVGAYQYGWETLHADYWQTWQEASDNNGNLDSQNGYDLPGDVGTFGDLVEDCADEGTTACSFINNTIPTPIPTQVFGTGSGAP
jgi:hypothetical protein